MTTSVILPIFHLFLLIYYLKVQLLSMFYRKFFCVVPDQLSQLQAIFLKTVYAQVKVCNYPQICLVIFSLRYLCVYASSPT